MDASERITTHIASLADDWRATLMTRLRALILDAAPTLTEEWKWQTPVWSQRGNVVALAAFKDHVKVNFIKGASLDDPQGLFNAGLDAKASRAIDIYESDAINEAALQDLVRAGVALNTVGRKK